MNTGSYRRGMELNLTPDQTRRITEAATLAAYALHHGAPSYATDLQPGNGTRYILLVTMLVNTHGDPSYIGGSEDNAVLSLPYFGTSYPCNLGGYFTEGYTGTKWTNGNETDGMVVATFLNVLGERMNSLRSDQLEV